MAEPELTLPAAILFDMDGTLTEPMLDFPRIKAEMGIGGRPILEALAELAADARAAAERVLVRHEEHAAAQSTLNPGCADLLEAVRRLRICTALITRNSRRSVDVVVAKHRLVIDELITRDEGPFKPDPHPLRLACAKLAIAPEQAWMIGDGQYDVEAGAAAGIQTVWISHGRARPFAAKPWRVVRDLIELRSLLDRAAAASRRDASGQPGR